MSWTGSTKAPTPTLEAPRKPKSAPSSTTIPSSRSPRESLTPKRPSPKRRSKTTAGRTAAPLSWTPAARGFPWGSCSIREAHRPSPRSIRPRLSWPRVLSRALESLSIRSWRGSTRGGCHSPKRTAASRASRWLYTATTPTPCTCPPCSTLRRK